MSEVLEGVVQEHCSKIVSGGKKVMGIVLGSGDIVWTGFKNPTNLGYAVGTNVKVPVEWNYGAWQYKPAGGASRPVPPQGGSSTAPSKGRNDYVKREFPVPLLHPDRAIIRQNSLAHASKLVAAQVDVTIEMSEEELAEYTIKIARAFEEYSSGWAEMKELEKNA